MNLFYSLKSFFKKSINPTVGNVSNGYFYGSTLFPSSAAGVNVSESTALNIPVVFACVNVLSSSMSLLPLRIRQETSGGKYEENKQHPLWRIFNVSPNPEMTACDFLNLMEVYASLWGNAYAEIIRDGSGRISQLWPVEPWRVFPKRINGELVYDVNLISGGVVRVPPASMFHVKSLSSNGIVGLSCVRVGCEAVGVALAQQTAAANFFSNDMAPSGILEYPQKLSPDKREEIAKAWHAGHQGVGNAHKVTVLDSGMKFTSITMPMADAQMIESRKFSVPEIARMFNMPLHKIQDMSASTNNNIEHMGIEFVQGTMMPWVRKFEQEICMKLLTPEEQSSIIAQFWVNELMRGDATARAGYYASGRQWGWLNANECRKEEGLNPLDGAKGSDYLRPVNMVPADTPAQVTVNAAQTGKGM